MFCFMTGIYEKAHVGDLKVTLKTDFFIKLTISGLFSWAMTLIAMNQFAGKSFTQGKELQVFIIFGVN